MDIKLLLNDIAIAHLDRKTQEELRRLKLVAQAASVVASNQEIKLIPGGDDLVTAIKQLA